MTSARMSVLAGLALLCATRAAAQSCTINVPPGSCTVSTGATLVIGKAVQLTLASTATTFAAPTEADYTAGKLDVAGQSITVAGNSAFVVSIAARTPTWTATSTVPGAIAWAAKPSTDLLIAPSTAGPFTALTTGGASWASYGATSGVTVPLVYRVLLSWVNDTPGQYSLDVVYTITAP